MRLLSVSLISLALAIFAMGCRSSPAPLPRHYGASASQGYRLLPLQLTGSRLRQEVDLRFNRSVAISPDLESFTSSDLQSKKDWEVYYCRHCQQTNPCEANPRHFHALGEDGQGHCDAISGVQSANKLLVGRANGPSLAPRFRARDVNNVPLNGPFNVTAYGAKGDNVADDWAALQSAATAASLAASRVMMTPGTYRTTRPIVVFSTGGYGTSGALIGAGYNSSIINAQFNGPAIIYAYGDTAKPSASRIIIGSGLVGTGRHAMYFGANPTALFDLNEALGLSFAGKYTPTPRGVLNDLPQGGVRFFFRDDDTASDHCVYWSMGAADQGLTRDGHFTGIPAGSVYWCVLSDAKIHAMMNINGTPIDVTSGSTTIRRGTSYETELNYDSFGEVNLYVGPVGGTITRVAQVKGPSGYWKQRADETHILGSGNLGFPINYGEGYGWVGAIQSFEIAKVARHIGASFPADTDDFGIDSNTVFLDRFDLNQLPTSHGLILPITEVDYPTGAWMQLKNTGWGCCTGIGIGRDFRVAFRTVGITGNAQSIDLDGIALSGINTYQDIETTPNSTFYSRIGFIAGFSSNTLTNLDVAGGLTFVKGALWNGVAQFPIITNGVSAEDIAILTNATTQCTVLLIGGGYIRGLHLDNENGGRFSSVCIQFGAGGNPSRVPTVIESSTLSTSGEEALVKLYYRYGDNSDFAGLEIRDSQIGLGSSTAVVDTSEIAQDRPTAGLIKVVNNWFIDNNSPKLPAGKRWTTTDVPVTELSSHSQLVDPQVNIFPAVVSNNYGGGVPGCDTGVQWCAVPLPRDTEPGNVLIATIDAVGSEGANPGGIFGQAGWTLACAADNHSNGNEVMTLWWHIAEVDDPATPKWSAANYSSVAINGLIEKVSGVSSANPIDRCFTTVGSNTLVGGTLSNPNDLVIVHPYHFCCTDVAITDGPGGIVHRSGNSIAGGSWSYLPSSLTARRVTFGGKSSRDWTGLQVALSPAVPISSALSRDTGLPLLYNGQGHASLQDLSLTGPLAGGANIYGRSSFSLLAAPPPQVIPNGAGGTATYVYYCVGYDANGGRTMPSKATIIANGNTTLNQTNYNSVSCGPVAGLVKWDFLKTNTSTSLASAVVAGPSGISTVNDTGQSTARYSPASRNTTGDVVLSPGAVAKISCSTVANLPTDVTKGSLACITDWNGTAGSCVGGGSGYSLTIYNGSAWVCQGGAGVSTVNPNVSSFCSGSGTSGGTYACYEPITGSGWKKAICILSNYYNFTSTAQNCGPYPTVFTSDSSVAVTKNLSEPLTTTHMTITLPLGMSVAESGVVIIEGN